MTQQRSNGNRDGAGGNGEPASCQFLTSHTHVLLCLNLDPTARMRDIAQRVGITERRAQAIVTELAEMGYLHREKAGRRNVYTVRRELSLHHPLWGKCSIGEILEAKRGAERLDACLSRLAGREVELAKLRAEMIVMRRLGETRVLKAAPAEVPA